MWVDAAVKALIKKYPEKQKFTCAAGISPSGNIHLGNFREFITSFFVAQGLKRAGKDVRFYLSWDSFDRLRKIPADIKKDIGDSFDGYVGMPYSEIPDPYGCHNSYAEHFMEAYKKSMEQLGIEAEYIDQSKCYKEGRYTEQIIHALKNRRFIYDVLYEYKSQEATDEGREEYVPISVYCRKCKHDSTVVTYVSEDGETITYTCKKCGHTETVRVRDYHMLKLVWKVDWPMRWAVEDVDFEPGGKDHGTKGSSYTVGKVFSKELYGKEAPDFVMYEFVGIKGLAGKMSSSTGLNFTPAEALKVYPPEMLLWIYVRPDSRQAFNFCLDEEALRLYHEFDRMYEALSKDNCPENIKSTMYYALCTTKEPKPNKVSAQLLATLGSIVNFDRNLTIALFKKLDPQVTEADIDERLPRIAYLMNTYMPEKRAYLLKEKNEAYYASLSDEEKKDIRAMYDKLSSKEVTLEELQTILYDIPRREGNDKKQDMELQKKFFENVYMLLIGSASGPRLYLFLGALAKDKYLPLLQF